jgi:hypothetical protein
MYRLREARKKLSRDEREAMRAQERGYEETYRKKHRAELCFNTHRRRSLYIISYFFTYSVLTDFLAVNLFEHMAIIIGN